MLINFAWNKSQYGFSLIRNFPYKDRILDSVLEENSGQRKPMFWHILRSVNPKISNIAIMNEFHDIIVHQCVLFYGSFI